MNLNPPEIVQIEKVLRNILADKPRITKFNINWDSEVTSIPSFNNHNFMFDEGKKTSENIQNNFFGNNTGSNPFLKTETSQLNMQNVFQEINNNKI